MPCPIFTASNGKVWANRVLTKVQITTSYSSVAVDCDPTCPGFYFGKIQTAVSGCNDTLFNTLQHCTLALSDLPHCRQDFEPVVIGITVAVVAIVLGLLVWAYEKGVLAVGARMIRRFLPNPRSNSVVEQTESIALHPVAVRRAPQPPSGPTIAQGNERNPTAFKSAIYSVYTIFCLLSILQGVLPCDYTHYQQSSPTSCTDGKCTSTNSILMQLQDGQTACFHSFHNTTTKLTFVGAHIVLSAIYQYDTARFQTKLDHETRCMSAGQCTHENCFKNKVSTFETSKSWSVTRVDCNIVRSTAFTCFYGTACSTGFVEIAPIEPRIPIYKIVSQHQALWIEFEKDGISRKIILTAGNMDAEDDIVSVVSTGPELSLFPYLALIEGAAYSIDASELNNNILSKIGELQILNDTISYPLDQLPRVPNDYTSGFVVPTQAVEAILFNPIIKSGLFKFTLTNESRKGAQLLASKRVARSAVFMIHTPRALQEFYDPPQCDFVVVGVVSCRSCSIPTQIQISSHNIIKGGLIHFTSNCDFDRATLACNGTTYLTCVGACDYECDITVVGAHSPALFINIVDQDLGDLTQAHKQQQYTLYGTVASYSDIITEWGTKTLASGIGVFLLIKIILCCWAFKTAKGALSAQRPTTTA